MDKVTSPRPGRPAKYPRDLLASIPEQLEAGKPFDAIAREMSTTPRLLMQTCRRNNILTPSEFPFKVPIDVELKMRKRAEEMGLSPLELATRMIEVISRDDLFSAVLD